MPRLKKKTKKPKSKFIVKASRKSGVIFYIDHQGFKLGIEWDPKDGIGELAYYRWYAKQLTIALKRLSGN